MALGSAHVGLGNWRAKHSCSPAGNYSEFQRYGKNNGRGVCGTSNHMDTEKESSSVLAETKTEYVDCVEANSTKATGKGQ